MIDDDYGVRESLKMILMDKYYVSTASHVDEAIHSLKIIEPEMIFFDIQQLKEHYNIVLNHLKKTSLCII